eukprot:6212771-Pleurochrysis_carterae.AAC.1
MCVSVRVWQRLRAFNDGSRHALEGPQGQGVDVPDVRGPCGVHASVSGWARADRGDDDDDALDRVADGVGHLRERGARALSRVGQTPTQDAYASKPGETPAARARRLAQTPIRSVCMPLLKPETACV